MVLIDWEMRFLSKSPFFRTLGNTLHNDNYYISKLETGRKIKSPLLAVSKCWKKKKKQT